MKDGPIRKTTKRIACYRYALDIRFMRLIGKIFGEPRYRLRGSCNRCGMCCESPMIPAFRIFFWLRSVRWLFLSWHNIINGFEYTGEDRKNKIFIFRCTHYDHVTKRCDSYDSRPGMCRDYPANLIYSVNPDFLSGCGYYAVLKKARRFRESLEKLNLPSKKLDELFEKLHLKE